MYEFIIELLRLHEFWSRVRGQIVVVFFKPRPRALLVS